MNFNKLTDMSSIDMGHANQSNNQSKHENSIDINMDLLKHVTKSKITISENRDIELKDAYNTVESLNLQLDKFLDTNTLKKSDSSSRSTASTYGNKVFMDSLNEVYTKIHSEINSIKDLILTNKGASNIVQQTTPV